MTIGLEPVHGRGVRENVQKGLAFIGFCPGQRPPDREAVNGTDKVQAQAQK